MSMSEVADRLLGDVVAASIGRVGWALVGEGNNRTVRIGQRFAELSILQGELVEGSDEGGHVGVQLGQLGVLVDDGLLELGDLDAQSGLGLVDASAFPDPLVELVSQVSVALGEGVPARMRSMAARMRLRSSGAGLNRHPRSG